MARTTKQAKRGRPPLPKNEKKLPSLGFRASLETRRKLEAAAAHSGRTLSQEIEFRLARSFLDEEAAGGKELYALFKLMGAAAQFIEEQTGKSWMLDHDTSVAVKQAWVTLYDSASAPLSPAILEFLKAPEPEPLPPLPKKPPMPTRNIGLLDKAVTADQARKASAAEWEKYDAAMAAHEKLIEQRQRLVERRREELNKLLRLMESSQNIGKQIALNLRQPKARAAAIKAGSKNQE